MNVARSSQTPRRPAALLPALLATVCMAAAPESTRAGLADAPREIEITRIDGSTLRGAIRVAGPALVLATPAGEEVCAWTDVLSLAPVGAGDSPALSPQGPFRLALSDGSVLSVRSFGAEAGRLRAESADRQTIFDMADVRTIERLDSSSTGTIRAVLDEPEPAADIVVVARDERTVTLRGAITAVAPTGVAFRWDRGDVVVPWERLAALRVARSNTRESPLAVRLRNGDVLTGRVVGGDGDQIEVQSALLDRRQIYWSDVVRIDGRSRRVTFLSDLRPTGYEFSPFLEKTWPPAMDRSLRGGPLRVAGREFGRGVVLHSRSLLVFSLAGEYQQFAAEVGILDETGGRGDAAVRVLGDGRVLWEAASVRAGEAPLPIAIDVSDIHVLTLVVDFGNDLDLGDHVVWAQARVIRP